MVSAFSTFAPPPRAVLECGDPRRFGFFLSKAIQSGEHRRTPNG
jgi:hypothetical protein